LKRLILFFAIELTLLLLSSSCTAPRSIIASGKVTPKGAFKAGFNTSFNIATAPIAEMHEATRAAVNAIDHNKDTLFYTETVAALARGLMAYTLDPITPTYDFYFRYGVLKRLDLGYKYASGAHVLDVMFQFLGTTGTPDDPDEARGLHGSIGFQYSGQNANLPSKVGLDKLRAIFRYNLSRNDILIPLVFSMPLGAEETYGNVTFGIVYGHSFIEYGFNPSKLLVRSMGSSYATIPSFVYKQNYSSFGAVLNAKIGYKYAYLLLALNIYHQNYRTYDLFGLQQESYKGFTIIPSLGLQLNWGYNKNKAKLKEL
jgi:hypothetical protein